MDPFQKSDNKPLDNMYQHTRYTNNIKKQQALSIFGHPSNKTFSLDLHEPFRVDSISDVYLDHFTTFDIGAINNSGLGKKQFFILKIDQFPLNGISNKSSFNNAIIIPNDDTSGDKTLKVHKGKKMNYVTTLMPGTIDKITGTITDWSGDNIFQDNSVTINDVPSTDGLTIVITAALAVGSDITEVITLTSNDATDGTGATTSGNTGTFSKKGTTANVAAAIIDAITDIIGAGAILGYTAAVTAGDPTNVVTFTLGEDVTSIAFDGSYHSDNSGNNLKSTHPHFLAEFVIVNRD